jgi:3,4-dihydroxy 2-butanone 4-phosphate synthase / GTP cyclohydrolase II
MPLTPIPDILDDLRAGKLIVLADDEDRENEGDLVCAAEKVTPQLINFMVRVGGGYMCVPLTEADCDRLELHPQAPANTALRGTALTVSVDGHPDHGVGTGVSAFDRCKTIRMLIDPASTPRDFVRPGHINPLRSRDGGVLVRNGQTEGTIDLMRLAGLHPSAVLIEVVREDGDMARMPDLEKLCRLHGLRLCSVQQIIDWRRQHEGAQGAGTAVAGPEGVRHAMAARRS